MVESPAGARALRACGPLQVDYFQTRPLLAFLLDRRRVESIGVVNPPHARSGVLLCRARAPRHAAAGVPAHCGQSAVDRPGHLYGGGAMTAVTLPARALRERAERVPAG